MRPSPEIKEPTITITSVQSATAATQWHPEHPPPSGDLTSPTGLLKDSLERRIRGMHALWLEALATMDETHVNHRERPNVLPIAFSVNHMVRIEDFSRGILAAEPALWDAQTWADRTQVGINDLGKDTTVAEMEHQQIDNYPAFCDYTRSVFEATEVWLAQLDSERLAEVLFGGIFPASLTKAYVHRVVRNERLLVIDAIECWIYQHGIRHLGELEHGRALVGLGGLTS